MKQIFYIALLFVSYNTSAQTSAYSQSRQYNDYIQPVNTQLVREVLAKKQTNYNRNAEKVQSKIDNIEKLLQKLYKTKGSYLTKNQKEYIDSIYKYVNNLSKESIADNYGIIQILRTLSGVEETLFDWL